MHVFQTQTTLSMLRPCKRRDVQYSKQLVTQDQKNAVKKY